MIQEMAYSCPRVGEVLPRAVMNVSTQAKEPSVPNLRMVRGVCRAMRLDGKQRVVLVLAAVLVLISGTQLDETASASRLLVACQPRRIERLRCTQLVDAIHYSIGLVRARLVGLRCGCKGR